MRIMFDSARCTGCKICQLICSASHTGEFNPARARIRIDNDAVAGQNAINVCRSCSNPLCVKACTYGACTRDQKLGVVRIDYEKCVACYACVEDCPFHADFVDPVEHVPLICDGCGGEPLCVEYCYEQALRLRR